MTDRRANLAAYYSPGYTPGYSPSPYQDANWFNDAWAGVTQSWQNENAANLAVDQNYREGAYGAGAAVRDAAGNLISPITEFAKGALRGIGVYVALGIIGYTLLNAREK